MYFTIISTFLLSTLINSCVGYPKQQQCAPTKPGSLVGTLVPIFIPADNQGRLNLSLYEPYLTFLKNSGIRGVLVLGGETASVEATQCEKLEILKTVLPLTKKLGLIAVVDVGNTNYNYSVELAMYTKKLGGNGVLWSAEDYYKQSNTSLVVQSMARIAKAAYPLPIVYSDLGRDCNYQYNIFRIINEAKQQGIKNFAGVKTILRRCLEVASIVDYSNLTIISSASYNLPSAYGFCLNGTSTLIANVFPRETVKIQQAALKGDFETANNIQKRISRIFSKCRAIVYTPEFIDQTMYVYIIATLRILMYIVDGFDLGYAPNISNLIPKSKGIAIYKACQEAGVARFYPY